MQPNQPNEDWQQPAEQPSNTPHPTAPVATPAPTPVVTMSPTSPNVATPAEAPSNVPAPSVAATEATEQGEPLEAPEEEPVHWQAQEYIHHEKNALWFVFFAIVLIGLMAIAIFLMNSISFAILIPVMAVALLVYIHRPPRVLDYTLSRHGLHINDNLYPFSDFKGFGVIHDGHEYSVMLIPTKRFRPGVSVYFPEEAGEAIVDMLGTRLPMQQLHLDLVDQLLRKLRI